MGSSSVDHTALEDMRAPLRDRVARMVSPDTPASVDTIDNGAYSTAIRGHFLWAWLNAARDLGSDVCKWLWEGAPAGIQCGFSQLDGLFPRVDAGERAMEPTAD